MNNLKYEETARKKHYTTHIFSDVVCVDYLFERSEQDMAEPDEETPQDSLLQALTRPVQ